MLIYISVIKEIERINAQELFRDLSESSSWHAHYQDSAYVYAGNIPYDLNEGDVIAVFSQWGEIVDIHLVRDRQTGKSKGFCFIGYEDQRSTILAVDNFNGLKIMERTVRVDHCAKYKGEAKNKNEEDEAFEERQRVKRRAVVPIHLLPPEDRPPEDPTAREPTPDSDTARALGLDPDDPMREYLLTKAAKKAAKKVKKEKKSKKDKKRKHSKDSDDDDNDSDRDSRPRKIDDIKREDSIKREDEIKRKDDDYRRDRRREDDYRGDRRRDEPIRDIKREDDYRHDRRRDAPTRDIKREDDDYHMDDRSRDIRRVGRDRESEPYNSRYTMRPGEEDRYKRRREDDRDDEQRDRRR
ncbi:hypothetical protein SmJEL517_g02498 [Synchytrium microbalum]|uniref:RRM domain-containing protein n=1 Tax=Synchytrium microbalum TaxID=1806994 RepID=A0A507CBQ9_9FUNG|nr:uncharacterized protein SmJEL517_g02498 [Synchytrium microbalum]TPX34995.1 hypothetical protein SmJEL517_g02498 [Synchytrium microbalum]